MAFGHDLLESLSTAVYCQPRSSRAAVGSAPCCFHLQPRDALIRVKRGSVPSISWIVQSSCGFFIGVCKCHKSNDGWMRFAWGPPWLRYGNVQSNTCLEVCGEVLCTHFEPAQGNRTPAKGTRRSPAVRARAHSLPWLSFLEQVVSGQHYGIGFCFLMGKTSTCFNKNGLSSRLTSFSLHARLAATQPPGSLRLSKEPRRD